MRSADPVHGSSAGAFIDSFSLALPLSPVEEKIAFHLQVQYKDR